MTDRDEAIVEAIRWGVTAETQDVSRSQIVISYAEFRAMQQMPGGVCFENWAKLRGLWPEAKES